MRKDIHPKWYANAAVNCVSCGKTWTTGATVPSIQTEICSNCHPFYTGEQRIVDTEGRVDRFMDRLKQRDQMIAKTEARKASLTPMDLPIAKLGLNKRYISILREHDINIVQDFMDRLSDKGDDNFREELGIGRQALIDIKKSLRAKGYSIPSGDAVEEAEIAETAEE